MTRGRGTAQNNPEKRGLIQNEKNQKGHRKTEKERKDTVNIFRIQEGCLVCSFHLLTFLQLAFVQWFSAQTPEPCWFPGTVKPVFKDLG